MKCLARVQVVAWVSFEIDSELHEKFGESYLEETAIEMLDLDTANFEVTDMEFD